MPLGHTHTNFYIGGIDYRSEKGGETAMGLFLSIFWGAFAQPMGKFCSMATLLFLLHSNHQCMHSTLKNLLLLFIRPVGGTKVEVFLPRQMSNRESSLHIVVQYVLDQYSSLTVSLSLSCESIEAILFTVRWAGQRQTRRTTSFTKIFAWYSIYIIEGYSIYTPARLSSFALVLLLLTRYTPATVQAAAPVSHTRVFIYFKFS